MAIAIPSAINYEELIQEDRVHARLYYDPAIFEDELQKVWYRQWIFVGHESEVPNPGDFRTGYIALQPIILIRGADNQVRVLLNRCRHRGNTVCQLKRGNAKFFTCAYHGWVYNSEGALQGVPYEEGYGDSLRKEELGLLSAPRVASYRGFIFASLSPDGPSLDDSLGFAKRNIDRFCDVSPTGELDMSAGVYKIKLKTNWKMWMENSVDSYHVPTTHASNSYLGKRNALQFKDPSGRPVNASTLVVSRDLGNGHSELDMRGARKVTGMWYTGEWSETVPPEAEQAYKEAMQRFHGEEKAERIFREGPAHTVIFPNLFFMLQEIRWAVPVNVGETNVYYAPCLLKGAPDEINTQRLRRDEGAYGPAGFQLADDIEVWERNYRGLQARQDEWILMNRGFDRPAEPDEEGVPAQAEMSELTIRAQWRHYKQLMTRL
ncbi:MAG TPA: aromatic ring-hydroxylating dioxygenase subunit alpha [Dehalococcoidia bacterium]|nr:aromatic ring-hydroxylating dioxygenase subunit alpha [Dehalococcoidia bacterium]